MVNILELNIGHMAGKHSNIHSFNDEVEVIKLEGSALKRDIPKEASPGRIKCLVIILTLEGRASIETDDKSYELSPNTIIDITGMRTLRSFVFSEDYRGYNLMVTGRFYDDAFRDAKHFTQEAFLKQQIEPLEKITAANAILLEEILERIIGNMKRTEHIWQRSLIMNEVRSFYLEVGNLIMNSLTGANDESQLSENDLIFVKFTQLLQDNSYERKSVSFYADKLCLTPDHFARIIKEFSGRSVSSWINEALLKQAKLYLRDPEVSVQQVADLLNFSDQSAFGKFFKSQTSMSPGEYRQSMR